jgi:TetR/AcrR family transcriptional repressor of nem operon
VSTQAMLLSDLWGRSMGRLKEFEMQDALEKAMNVFWEKGYENTSLKDLLSEMNILNGSFYNTFGNKKSLYLKVLEHYSNDTTAKRVELLNCGENFSVGIRLFFEGIFNCFADENTPKGCLLVDSLSSELLKDEEIQIFVCKGMSEFEGFFQNFIDQAIERGELSSDTDSETISSILVTYIQGLMKRSSIHSSPKCLEKQTEHFLTSLGL